jgi:phospholipid-binding lipoprotein MlaA
MRQARLGARLLLVAGLLALAGGCAAVPQDPAERALYEETNDPLEPLNRKLFDFNMFLDRNAIKPVALAYRDYLPEAVRTGIRNFLNNLSEPVIFVNNLLQGEPKRAGTTLTRFIGNSFVGGFGFVDVAAKAGAPRQNGDFGQTLWAWGVPDGPFLMLPLLGPSNPRDSVGQGVDGYFDPFSYVVDSATGASTAIGYSRFALDGIDRRASTIDELDEIQKSAIDVYAQIRSLWRQNRRKELYNGSPPAPGGEEDLYKDPAAQ